MVTVRFTRRRTYAEVLVAYQRAHGWNRQDMDPEQLARFRALEAAGGDVTAATHLSFGRWQYRTGAMHDDKR